MHKEQCAYFDFRQDGINTGYFELRISAREIYQNAVFYYEGELSRNPFVLYLDGDKVLSCKVGDTEKDLSTLPANHFPGSAWPLLLRLMGGKNTLSYMAIREGDMALLGETLLQREGDVVKEMRNGSFVREFEVTEGEISRINWGGPESHRRASYEEAIAGSPLA